MDLAEEKRALEVRKQCQRGTRSYNEANGLHADCFGVIGMLLEHIKKLERGEFVCRRCHRRKDGEKEPGEPEF